MQQATGLDGRAVTNVATASGTPQPVPDITVTTETECVVTAVFCVKDLSVFCRKDENTYNKTNILSQCQTYV